VSPALESASIPTTQLIVDMISSMVPA
jgi:hypothetical protein